MMRAGERKLLDEALGDLRGSLNAIGRAMRVINGVTGCERERERLRRVETDIRQTVEDLAKRLAR